MTKVASRKYTIHEKVALNIFYENTMNLKIHFSGIACRLVKILFFGVRL